MNKIKTLTTTLKHAYFVIDQDRNMIGKVTYRIADIAHYIIEDFKEFYDDGTGYIPIGFYDEIKDNMELKESYDLYFFA